ncbi:hypothetical protein [Corallococcus sp. Z5C101001]|uniref:hypothetical protein n=1 Tax=Corallococcus sp. Z5C101001 TaxID=2596829 RepID=UPI00117C2728|nr:hypothetical protein [Corallococcus sp. Z5C101001]TSC28497.1 hypothetical protein FOF48_17795 [Corallococcus sp. Z5C101001]
MLKLYKKDGDTLRYWEAWEHEGVVTVHWGTVGDGGEQKAVPVPPEEDPDMVIAQEAESLVDAGYDEPEPDAMAVLLVEYAVQGKGTGHDFEQRSAVEELLMDALGWTGNGEVEGGETEEGVMRVHCRVMDPEMAARTVVEALDAEELLEGARVLVARGDEKPRVVHPPLFPVLKT